jgi:hypothetical protein
MQRLAPTYGRSFGPLARLLAVGLLLAGCGAEPDPARVERVDSAGVALVMNRGEDRPLDWRFERVFSLGGADDGVESFHNVGRGAVAAGDDGLLYVLDRGNHRVVVFDDGGRHVRTLSRRGGGPGELQWPQTIAMEPSGDLAITDIGHRGLVRMTATGEPLEHRIFEDWNGGGIARFGDGMVVQKQVGAVANGSSSHELHVLDDDGGRALAAFPATPMRPVDFGCVRISGMPRLFAPSLAWATGGTRAAAVGTASYDIELHEPAGLLARVRRDLPPRPATRELAIQEVGEAFSVGFGSGGGCSVEPGKVVDERGFADVIPAVRRVAVGPDGTLWVLRFAVRGDPAPVDVFADDGEYLGTLPPQTPFPDAFFPDGRVIALEKDDLDLDHVVVYRVMRETRTGVGTGGPALAVPVILRLGR